MSGVLLLLISLNKNKQNWEEIKMTNSSKQTVVLGKAGSGRTRYLAKEIVKIIEGGNNAIYITDEHTRAHIEGLVSENLGTSDPYGKLLIFEAKTKADISFLLGQSVGHFAGEPSTTLFLDLNNNVTIATAIEIMTAVLPVYDNANVVYTGLLSDEGVLLEDSPFNTDIKKVYLNEETGEIEDFEGTQHVFYGTQHVVVGRTGVGRTRYLVKKALDASKANKRVVFISDEHTPRTLHEYISKQETLLNTENLKGSFICTSVNTIEGLITALHDVVGDLEKGENIELLIDLHNKNLIKQAISTVNTYLATYKNLDITFSVQVNHDIDPQHSAGIIESESLPFIVAPENITVLGVSAQ